MKNKNILCELYEKVMEELTPSSKYNHIEEKFINEKEEFLEQIGEENRDGLEKITDLVNAMYDEIDKQVFCEGFAIAMKLFIEAII